MVDWRKQRPEPPKKAPDLELSGPIDHLGLRESQHWRSLMVDIGQRTNVAEAVSPYEVLFDFRTLQVGDSSEVTVEIALYDTDGQVVWHLADSYTIEPQGDTPSGGHLAINGEQATQSRLVTFAVPEGPWACRVSYVQTRGFNKLVRLMRVS